MARSRGPQASFLNRLWWSSDNERQCSLLTPEGWGWPGLLPLLLWPQHLRASFQGKKRAVAGGEPWAEARPLLGVCGPHGGSEALPCLGTCPAGREPGAGREPRRVQPCPAPCSLKPTSLSSPPHPCCSQERRLGAADTRMDAWSHAQLPGLAAASSVRDHSSGHDLLGWHRRGCWWQVVTGLGHGRLHPGWTCSLAHAELS